MLLEGMKAIVTGGARGIGKEIVTAFLKEGASVFFIDLIIRGFKGSSALCSEGCQVHAYILHMNATIQCFCT